MRQSDEHVFFPLSSQIMRAGVVILKNCLLQTDVFNLVMRMYPFHLHTLPSH